MTYPRKAWLQDSCYSRRLQNKFSCLTAETERRVPVRRAPPYRSGIRPLPGLFPGLFWETAYRAVKKAKFSLTMQFVTCFNVLHKSFQTKRGIFDCDRVWDIVRVVLISGHCKRITRITYQSFLYVLNIHWCMTVAFSIKGMSQEFWWCVVKIIQKCQ